MIKVEAAKREIFAKMIAVFRLSFVVAAKSNNKLSLLQRKARGVDGTSLRPVNFGNWPVDQSVVVVRTFCGS